MLFLGLCLFLLFLKKAVGFLLSCFLCHVTFWTLINAQSFLTIAHCCLCFSLLPSCPWGSSPLWFPENPKAWSLPLVINILYISLIFTCSKVGLEVVLRHLSAYLKRKPNGGDQEGVFIPEKPTLFPPPVALLCATGVSTLCPRALWLRRNVDDPEM